MGRVRKTVWRCDGQFRFHEFSGGIFDSIMAASGPAVFYFAAARFPKENGIRVNAPDHYANRLWTINFQLVPRDRSNWRREYRKYLSAGVGTHCGQNV